MSGLLSGLEKFGIESVSAEDIFSENKTATKRMVETKTVDDKTMTIANEESVLFDKTYTCLVCDGKFKNKTVKTGRTRVQKTDYDLRPIYEGVDALKYDVVSCPHCGFAALTRYYTGLTAVQKKAIREQISRNYHMQDMTGREYYTYDDAIARYKLALANAIVKSAPASEKAYICMKTAWLIRGKLENLQKEGELTAELKDQCEKEEDDFLRNAMEGYQTARMKELPPLCGMDEATLDFIIATYAARFGQYDVATKLISNIILSPRSNSRIKDRTRELKDAVIAKIKSGE